MGKMDVQKPGDKGFGSPGDDRYGGKEAWAKKSKPESLPDDAPTGNSSAPKRPTSVRAKDRQKETDDYIDKASK